MATLQLLARCRTSGSGSSLNSAKILLAALGARTVLCCLLILKLFPPFQMTYKKRPLLERSIPECRGRSRCLLCIAQSSFQQQSTPNVVFLTRGFYLSRFDTAFHAHIIPNISHFAHSKRRLQRGGFAGWERRGCFGAMRSDGEKDGSDPISTRRHFAERLDGTGKM